MTLEEVFGPSFDIPFLFVVFVLLVFCQKILELLSRFCKGSKNMSVKETLDDVKSDVADLHESLNTLNLHPARSPGEQQEVTGILERFFTALQKPIETINHWIAHVDNVEGEELKSLRPSSDDADSRDVSNEASPVLNQTFSSLSEEQGQVNSGNEGLEFTPESSLHVLESEKPVPDHNAPEVDTSTHIESSPSECETVIQSESSTTATQPDLHRTPSSEANGFNEHPVSTTTSKPGLLHPVHEEDRPVNVTATPPSTTAPEPDDLCSLPSTPEAKNMDSTNLLDSIESFIPEDSSFHQSFSDEETDADVSKFEDLNLETTSVSQKTDKSAQSHDGSAAAQQGILYESQEDEVDTRLSVDDDNQEVPSPEPTGGPESLSSELSSAASEKHESKPENESVTSTVELSSNSSSVDTFSDVPPASAANGSASTGVKEVLAERPDHTKKAGSELIIMQPDDESKKSLQPIEVPPSAAEVSGQADENTKSVESVRSHTTDFSVPEPTPQGTYSLLGDVERETTASEASARDEAIELKGGPSENLQISEDISSKPLHLRDESCPTVSEGGPVFEELGKQKSSSVENLARKTSEEAQPPATDRDSAEQLSPSTESISMEDQHILDSSIEELQSACDSNDTEPVSSEAVDVSVSPRPVSEIDGESKRFSMFDIGSALAEDLSQREESNEEREASKGNLDRETSISINNLQSLFLDSAKVQCRKRKRNPRAILQKFGVAEDMNRAGMRRGKKRPMMGKKYQMEDKHFAEFPFHNDPLRALFCVFDGHAGKRCAEHARAIFHKEFENQLQKYGGEVKDPAVGLKEVFINTFLEVDKQLEEHEYEGTTATAVYIWREGDKDYLQSANVGDSTPFLCRSGQAVSLGVDHRVTDPEEQERMRAEGVAIHPGQSRLNGLAVSRALGDHFVKANVQGLIATPYVSDLICLNSTDTLLIIASDGIWDVMSGQEAMDTVMNDTSARAMAQKLVRIAVSRPKCHDNVTAITAIL